MIEEKRAKGITIATRVARGGELSPDEFDEWLGTVAIVLNNNHKAGKVDLKKALLSFLEFNLDDRGVVSSCEIKLKLFLELYKIGYNISEVITHGSSSFRLSLILYFFKEGQLLVPYEKKCSKNVKSTITSMVLYGNLFIIETLSEDELLGQIANAFYEYPKDKKFNLNGELLSFLEFSGNREEAISNETKIKLLLELDKLGFDLAPVIIHCSSSFRFSLIMYFFNEGRDLTPYFIKWRSVIFSLFDSVLVENYMFFIYKGCCLDGLNSTSELESKYQYVISVIAYMVKAIVAIFDKDRILGVLYYRMIIVRMSDIFRKWKLSCNFDVFWDVFWRDLHSSLDPRELARWQKSFAVHDELNKFYPDYLSVLIASDTTSGLFLFTHLASQARPVNGGIKFSLGPSDVSEIAGVSTTLSVGEALAFLSYNDGFNISRGRDDGLRQLVCNSDALRRYLSAVARASCIALKSCDGEGSDTLELDLGAAECPALCHRRI